MARLRDNVRDIRHAVIVCDQRRQRFKTHIALREMGIMRINIRRVADDHVKLLPRQRREPVALQYANIVNRQMLRITASQRHGVWYTVYRRDFAVRSLCRQRQRNRAGSGAEVENPTRRIRQTRQRLLDQTFGVRARNQRSGETNSGSDQNSRMPVRCATGSPR